MESNNVRVPSPATFTADIHRSVCEWEVRVTSDVVAITLIIHSLSGRDAYDLDSAHLYHEHNYRALPHPLQIPQDGYAHSQFAYASHSSGGALPGKLLYLCCFILPVHMSALLYIPCESCTSRPIRSLLVVAPPRPWVAGSGSRRFSPNCVLCT